MQRTLILLPIFLLIVMACYGSNFRNYQVDDGLSHNSVWYVMQDSDGFMWFGTNDGLNRFDGKNFKVYKHNPNDSTSIGHNFIHCIREDSKNRMLVGTRNGLYLYNKKLDNFICINLSKSKKQDININDITEDSYGNIWIASHGNGLYKLNQDLSVEKHFSLNDSPQTTSLNYIWTVVTDHLGNLWLGTAGKGLVHFDPKNEVFTPITDRKNLNISDQSIYSIHCDRNNDLWIGTSTKGLFKYNFINGNATHYLNNTGNIKSIIAFSNKELIMGSDHGLIIFDKESGKYNIPKEESGYENITDNSIFSITKDREGAFWIGTYFNGINYFSPSVSKFLYFSNLSESKTNKYIVSSMTENYNGNILIATHNNNIIYEFSPQNHTTKEVFKMPHSNIQNIFKDNDKLYVSTYGRGISILSIKNGKEIGNLAINTIEGKSIFKISNDRLLLALEEGGSAWLNQQGEIKRIKQLQGKLIADIIEDNTGNIWFATHSYDLFCLKKNGNWINFSSEEYDNKLSGIRGFNGLLCDRKNRIWICTKNDGVILFNPETNKIEKTFDAQNGLPSNITYSIVNDKNGNIWVSTQKGIVRITVDNINDLKIFGYIGKEIQYNSKCILRTSSGILYFGGANGFISINPNEMVVNNIKPTIVITGFKIFNKEMFPGKKLSPLKAPLSQTQEIILERNQSNFSFEFTALSYVFPEANQYAYILEGFDKEWNYVTDNTAQYMNIPPGKYTFRVKGSNNDGIWNEAGTRINILVKPPLWQEWYMILLYITLIGSSIFYIIKQYYKHLDAVNKEKQYKFQIAKEKEVYESQINFFTNIAHEIRTPLSLITAPLEKIIRSRDGNKQTQKHLNSIERNTNRLLDLVNQLLDFRKIENDMFILNYRLQSIEKIVQKVFKQYEQDTKLHNIKMTIEMQKDVISYVDSEALYKIISNLISNAIKFTKDKIKIKLSINDNNYFLSVEDNGIGIKEAHLDKIFETFYQIQTTDNTMNKGSGLGLSLSKALAQKLGGDIFVQSNYGKGSIFTLALPIKSQETLPQEIDDSKNDTDISELAETGQNILIVDDNSELRIFIKECLSDKYTVTEANNGIEALKIIENKNIDIIISDIMMPVMDGLELCNELKSNIAYSHLPLILLSAKTDTSTKIEGLKKGADIYMEKPFSIEQLEAQIASIIENRDKIRKNFIESPLQYFKQNPDNKDNIDFIQKLNTFILENMSDEHFSIDNIASQFAISRTNLNNKIKNISGITPNDYIKLIRLNKSAELLGSGKYRINEVCFLVGFNSPSYFSKCFFEHFGKLPKDYMQMGTASI